MQYEINFLTLARQDRIDIQNYLKKFYPNTPKKFIAHLKKSINNLKEAPYMYSLYEWNKNYRRIVVDKYLVFYKIDEKSKVVNVYRILPGSWDLSRYFENDI
jgi:plasmid stabilization system protein ParE